MTWRWPSTAETCSHRQTNKYDPTTVVFWWTHPPSLQSIALPSKHQELLTQWHRVTSRKTQIFTWTVVSLFSLKFERPNTLLSAQWIFIMSELGWDAISHHANLNPPIQQLFNNAVWTTCSVSIIVYSEWTRWIWKDVKVTNTTINLSTGVLISP